MKELSFSFPACSFELIVLHIMIRMQFQVQLKYAFVIVIIVRTELYFISYSDLNF